MVMSSYKTSSSKGRFIFIKHYRKILKSENIKNIPVNQSACRVCLKKGSLSITDSKTSFDIAQALKIFGNVEIEPEDTHSKQLCKICYKFLHIAYLFRKVAFQTQNILSRRTIVSTENKEVVVKSEEIYIGEQIVENSTNKIVSDANVFTSELDINLIDDGDDSKDFTVSENEDIFPSYPKRTQKKDNSFSEKITCEMCNKVVSRSYYKYHKTMHDPNHKNYQCDVCGKSFRLRCSYYNHSLRHRSDFSYKCQHCPYQGKYKELLRAHMRIHTQEQNYMCTECPAKFRFKSNLNKHILRHKEPKIKCDRCSRAFHTQPDLKQHIDVDHLSIRSHVCDDCGKAFGSRKGMMKHQKTVHKRKKMMTGRMPAYLLAKNNAISSV